MSRNEKRIRDCLKAIGYQPRSVRWEPVGPCFEMMGRSGGWIIDDMIPVGLNVDEAIGFIKRCPDTFRDRV